MRPLAVILALAAAAPAGAQQTPPDPARVYELAEVEVLPRPQNVPDLIAALHQGYPPHLRAAGVGGTVHVAFVVGPEGQPEDVRVLSTPDSSFNTPSVQAVSLLRFTPAQVQGRPVAVRVEQPITWRVEVQPDFIGQGVRAGRPAEESAQGNAVDGYAMSEVDELPRLLNVPVFQSALARGYPMPLRAAGVSGIVQVRFRVEVDGTTTHATITRSSNSEFNAATLNAVRGLRFRPARLNGQAVRAWVEQPIEWVVQRTNPPMDSPARP
jgi:TonB family protein